MPDKPMPDNQIILPETLQQNLIIGTWTYEVSLSRLIWSDNLFRIMGITPETFTYDLAGYQKCLHPEDRDRIMTDLQVSLTEKTPFNHQYRILRPNGEERWLQTFGDVLLDQQGEIYRVQGACQDITEQIQNRQDLQTIQTFNEKLFQLAEDLIFIHPLTLGPGDGVLFEQFNPAVTRHLGFHPEELKQMGPWDLCSEQQIDELKAEVNQLHGVENITLKVWFKTRNGAAKHYELHCHAYQEGDKCKVLAVGRSLESRQQHDWEQAQVEKRLNALLELHQTPFASEKDLIEACLAKAVELTDSQVGYVYLLEAAQPHLLLGHCAPLPPFAFTASWSVGLPPQMAAFFDQCIQARQPMIHNQPEAVASLGQLPARHRTIQRHLNVPVLEADAVRMILGVGNKAAEYNETDTRQLQLLAEQVWQLLERHRNADRVRQQQANYKSLIQAMGEGVMMVDQGGNLLAHNPKAIEILGLEGVPLEGLNYRDQKQFARLKPIGLDHQAFDFVEFATEITLKTGRAVHDQVLGFRRPDGVTCWLKLHSEPVWGPSPQLPDAAVVTFQDITLQRQNEQIQAEQALALQERLKELHCLQQVSELASKNWAHPSAFYQAMVQLLPPAFRFPEHTHAELSIEGQTFRSQEFCEQVEVVYSVPVIWEGQILGQLRISSDLNTHPELMPEEIALMHNVMIILLRLRDRLQSRQGLESLNQQLESEVNARTLELTSAIRNLHGRVKELQILNQVALLLQGEAPLLELRPQLENLMNTTGLSPDSGIKLRLLLETEFEQSEHSLLCLPIMVNNQKKACLCILSQHHATEEINPNERALLETLRHLLEQFLTRQIMQASLIRARQAAEEANQSKTLFLANMSHEIRTPMNAILGFSQLLREKIQEPRQKQYLDTIIHSGEALLRLINDILDLSKIEAGKLELHLQPVNLLKVLTDTQALLALSFERKGLKFSLEMESDLPLWLELDSVRVQQILLNLLGNALKFTPQGEVQLRAHFEPLTEQSGRLILDVYDTGIGIALDQQERIFEAFEQAQSSIQGGTGLGLAIAYRLAELMHAQLTVSSQPGQGSLFTLAFDKVMVTPPPDHLDPVKRSRPDDFLPARLVIADDVETNLLLTRSMLEAYPFTIYSAGNGLEACELAEKIQPDLILMDIKMPVMDGIEAFQLLRQTATTADIPVIALTAFSLNQDEESLLKQGFDGYLRKPIERDRFMRVLEHFLPLKTQQAAEDPSRPASAVVTTEALSPEALADLRSRFEQEIFPLWESRQDSYILDELEHFVARLAEVIEPYDLPLIRQHLMTARNQLDGLEMEAAQTSLHSLMAEAKSLFAQPL